MITSHIAHDDTALEIEECIVRLHEIAHVRGDARFLLQVAAKAKKALDRMFGFGNCHSARLVGIVMADVPSARDDVPPQVAQALLRLLRQVARGCNAQPAAVPDAIGIRGRRRTDTASSRSSFGPRSLCNPGRRAEDLASCGLTLSTMDLRRSTSTVRRGATSPVPQRRASDAMAMHLHGVLFEQHRHRPEHAGFPAN
jgi:hypothetical protein